MNNESSSYCESQVFHYASALARHHEAGQLMDADIKATKLSTWLRKYRAALKRENNW